MHCLHCAFSVHLHCLHWLLKILNFFPFYIKVLASYVKSDWASVFPSGALYEVCIKGLRLLVVTSEPLFFHECMRFLSAVVRSVNVSYITVLGAVLVLMSLYAEAPCGVKNKVASIFLLFHVATPSTFSYICWSLTGPLYVSVVLDISGTNWDVQCVVLKPRREWTFPVMVFNPNHKFLKFTMDLWGNDRSAVNIIEESFMFCLLITLSYTPNVYFEAAVLFFT